MTKRRSPFQSLGRDSVGLDLPHVEINGHRRRGFNPSVGILLVWTGSGAPETPALAGFQSLGRDSVSLDAARRTSSVRCRSFQSLGRDSVGLDWHVRGQRADACLVSIPRSGFCWFGLDCSLLRL